MGNNFSKAKDKIKGKNKDDNKKADKTKDDAKKNEASNNKNNADKQVSDQKQEEQKQDEKKQNDEKQKESNQSQNNKKDDAKPSENAVANDNVNADANTSADANSKENADSNANADGNAASNSDANADANANANANEDANANENGDANANAADSNADSNADAAKDDAKKEENNDNNKAEDDGIVKQEVDKKMQEVLDDERAVLAVTVKRAYQLASPDNEKELEAYLQLTFGYLEHKSKRQIFKRRFREAFNALKEKVADKLEEAKEKLDENNKDEENNEETDDNKVKEEEHFMDDKGPNEEKDKKYENGGIPDNEMGRDTLAAGNASTETQKSKVEFSDASNVYFNQTFYFPVQSINARHSLELSVWDDEIGPQVADHFIGKCILYYGKHKGNNDELNKDEYDNFFMSKGQKENADQIVDNNIKYKYFLPIGFDNKKEYTVDICDNDRYDSNGKVDLIVQFMTKDKLRDHYKDDGWTSDEADDDDDNDNNNADNNENGGGNDDANADANGNDQNGDANANADADADADADAAGGW